MKQVKQLRILLLADASSAHTQKWVTGLISKNINILLFSLRNESDSLRKLAKESDNLQITSCDKIIVSKASAFSKSTYLTALPKLKQNIQDFKPDLVHAHYATSYGLLALLSKFRPYLISVWGSDILQFPERSPLHKVVFKVIVNKAKRVFSSSKLMAESYNKFSKKNHCEIIPFGIDLNQFNYSEPNLKANAIKFCIVKTMAHTYGIDIAINAFLKLKNLHPQYKLSLHIAGDGPELENYKQLAGTELDESIFFHGKIEYASVPQFIKQNDVFLNLSRSESFGVSVIEASACGRPVIVSNRGGVPETTVDQKTGFILKDLDVNHCVDAMTNYIEQPNLIIKHGLAGRKYVEDNYNFQQNLASQINVYEEILISKK